MIVVNVLLRARDHASLAAANAPDQARWNRRSRSPLHRHSIIPAPLKAIRRSAMADSSTAMRPKQTIAPPAKISISLTINGVRRQIDVAAWTTLLDLLRDRLDLTGTKKGCDHGQCG